VALWYNGGVRTDPTGSSPAQTDAREPLKAKQEDNTMEGEKNILIVDDDVELGDLLASAVSNMSDTYNIKVARNVDQAMIQVRKSQTSQRPFDLVITDIKMTGLNGLEFLEVLSSIAPGIKTIAMTAYNSPDLASHAHELRVCAYLTKPFVISEFRQAVLSALETGPTSTVESGSEPTTKLTSAQETAVGEGLAAMRTMTGAVATLLMRANGTVLATDILEPGTDLDGICVALTTAQRAIARQMSQTFSQDTQIVQSYFGTATFNICTYRVDESHIAAVIFGPAVREGQVWFYMREAVDRLRDALGTQVEQPTARQRAREGDVFEMLDRFFPGRQKRSRRKEPDTTAKTVAARETAPAQAESPPDTDLSSLDGLDWDVPIDEDWDALVKEADQGSGGISFEEAQSQGLLSQDVAAELEPEAETAAQDEPSPDLPPVDEIDWEISTDVDWDTLAAETDQGLGGMSFDEAQRRGLVSDVASE
jgi:CheY-like chemotaxis protein/predicted regulator of Ras-like GTPase activity (Roadblock/LC7/MglB family)